MNTYCAALARPTAFLPAASGVSGGRASNHCWHTRTDHSGRSIESQQGL